MNVFLKHLAYRTYENHYNDETNLYIYIFSFEILKSVNKIILTFHKK